MATPQTLKPPASSYAAGIYYARSAPVGRYVAESSYASRFSKFLDGELMPFIKRELSSELQSSLLGALLVASFSHTVARALILKFKPKLHTQDRIVLCVVSTALSMGVRFALLRRISSTLFIGAISLIGLAALEMVLGNNSNVPLASKQKPQSGALALASSERVYGSPRGEPELSPTGVQEQTLEPATEPAVSLVQVDETAQKELEQVRLLLAEAEREISDLKIKSAKLEETLRLRDELPAVRFEDRSLPSSPARRSQNEEPSPLEFALAENKDLSQKLLGAAARIASLEQQLKDLQAYQDLARDLERGMKDLEALESASKTALEEKDAFIDELNIDNQKLSSQIQGLQREIESKNDTIQALEAHIQDLRADLDTYKRGKRLATPVKRQMRASQVKLEEDAERRLSENHEENLGQLQEVSEEHQSQLAQLKASYATEYASLEEENRRLREEIENGLISPEDLQELRDKLGEAENEIAHLHEVPFALIEALKNAFLESAPEKKQCIGMRSRQPLGEITSEEAAGPRSGKPEALSQTSGSDDFAGRAIAVIDSFLESQRNRSQ